MVSNITQPINWGDLLRDTMHLSTIAFGAYVRLIGHYWNHGGLPEDDRALFRITGLEPRQWRRNRPMLQAFFHDGWKHKRIDADLARREKFRAAQKEKASRRWASDPVDNPVDNLWTNCGKKKTHLDEPCLDSSTSKSLKSNGAPYAGAMPSVDLYKKERGKQDFGQSRPAAPERQKSKSYFQARAAWEAALAKGLGPDDYAKALDHLVTNPTLCERATAAEQRKAGSGAQTVALALLKTGRT
jgi:uncharacterized protein YdaU (DUF1376 family)